MKTQYRDWKPVVRSIAKCLQEEGFALDHVDDGEEVNAILGTSTKDQRESTAELVCAVDESTLFITKDGKRSWLFIVLGNQPEETIADYSASGESIDRACDRFSEIWEDRRCPIVEA